MITQESFFDNSAELELEALLRRAAFEILKTENAEEFVRWFQDHAREIAPGFFQTYAADAAASRSFAAQFARVIWNRTPLPGNGYLPRPLPEPAADAPCYCGSGRVYGDCCADHGLAEMAMPHLSMLPFVLENLTPQQFIALPYADLSPDGLGFAAELWMEQGRFEDAAELLEGLFAQIDRLDERSGHSFDRLLVCYDRLGKPEAKARMLEIGMNARDAGLRSAVLQRQCCILTDSGEYAQAWALFYKLQQLNPRDPALAHLEVMLLIGQGELANAQQRAKSLLENLQRENTAAQEHLIEFLSAVASGEAVPDDDDDESAKPGPK